MRGNGIGERRNFPTKNEHTVSAKWVSRTVNTTNGHYEEKKPNRVFAVQFRFEFVFLVLYRSSRTI